MDIAAYILFFVAVIGVLTLAQHYLWVKLVRNTRLFRPSRWHQVAVVSAGVLVFPLVIGLSIRVDRRIAVPMASVVYLWMGFLFYLVLSFLSVDLVRLVVGGWRRLRRKISFRRPTGEALSGGESPPDRARPASGRTVSPSNGERRLFLARVTAIGAIALSGGVATAGVLSVLNGVGTKEVTVTLDRLPPALDGYRIALLSDLHIGPVLGEDFARRVVEITNAARPDLVAITGDLVDGTPDLIGYQVAPLEGLVAADGVLFVTGNHEYYSGAQDWVDFLDGLGVRTLLNERILVERGGQGLYIAGVTDYQARRYLEDHAPDLERALDGRDPRREVVLLAHQPRHIHDAARADVGLLLSGHTHGGQIWPFGYMVRLDQPYVQGLHRHAGGSGRTQIYVTAGTGFWGPPMRVFAPAEVSIITLRAGGR